MLLFTAAAVLTVLWCESMASMGAMAMPGDWTMSMVWMRMPGQSWLESAAAFVGMWVVMMAAMMLPVLGPMLLRYRRDLDAAVGNRSSLPVPRGRLTALVGAGYFSVWAAAGAMAFPVGAGLAMATMGSKALARVVPWATGVVVVLAGVLQFSAWKARHLACCRGLAGASCAPAPCSVVFPHVATSPSGWGRDCGASSLADARTAWRHGVRLGLHCTYCCAGFTAVLLVIGVMEVRAMAFVTAAITLERLAPAGQRIARTLGVVLVGAGLVLIARAM